MSPLVLLGIAARRILAAGRGAPWLALLVASALAARSIAAVDPAATERLRASIHLLTGAAAALAIALFAPAVLAGLTRGRPADPFLASRPLTPAGRAAGVALGAAAAGLLVFLAFAATLALAGGSLGGALRPRLATLPAQAGALEADASRIAVPFEPADGTAVLEVAPRIGYAWGYGDPNPVRLAVRIAQESFQSTNEVVLRGRERVSFPVPLRGAATVTIVKVGEGPIVRFPEGSLTLLGAPGQSWQSALELAARLALVLFAAASAATLFATLLDRPVAALASGAFVVIVLASGLPTIRDGLGVGALLDLEGLFDRRVTPFPAGAALRCAAAGAAALALASLLRRTRL